MEIKTWNIETMTGYKPFTTFYEDLSIADAFGTKAILETMRDIIQAWGHDYKYITEFIMAVNWKSWEHQNNEEYCKLYAEMYYMLHDWALDNFKDEALQYYLETTD